MKNRYFYLPLVIIATITVILAYFAYGVNPNTSPFISSLLVNLLASGITVVCTALLIDRSIRSERRSDSQPGLKYINKILRNEVKWFMQNVGYMKDALDTNTALGSNLDLSRRDLDAEYKKGLYAAKHINKDVFAGHHKNTAGWMYFPTERLLEAIEETLSNFSYAMSYADMTKLYELKKDISMSLVQIKQSLESEHDIVEGYASPDQGYISNRDYDGGRLTSLNAYYMDRIIKKVLEIERMKLKSPST